MPLYHYCSTAGCGAKIAYEAVKPAACPKCRKPVKDAAAMLAQAATLVQPIPQPVRREEVHAAYPDDDAPLAPPARSPRSRPAHRPDRPARAPEPLYHDEVPGDRSADEEHSYDRRASKALARQLAASIDPSSIRIGVEGGEPDDLITFETLWAQGAASRQQGATS